MLTAAEIVARRSFYACCTLQYRSDAVLAYDEGDTKCYRLNKEKADYMRFAALIMASTPVDDTEEGCETFEFATLVADYADCICNVCECPEPEVDCNLTADYTVLLGVDVDDLPLAPATGAAYYIISGSTLNLGNIATWDGAAYVYTVVTNPSIIWATTSNIYYTNLGTGDGPGLLFPAPILTLIVSTPASIWYLSTNSPQTENGRTIQLQGLGPNGWYNISAEINEDDLDPYIINLTGLPYTAVRLVYTLANGCVYYSANGTFVPPVVPPAPCDIIPDYTVAATVDANQQGLTANGTFLIVTDESSMGNEWADHLGEIVTVNNLLMNPYSYTVLAVGETVYDIATTTYWQVFPDGLAPMFPPVTLTNGVGTYLIESDYPVQSASGSRFMLVEGVINGNLVVIWAGYEYDLPITYPEFGIVTSVQATYFLPGPCTYTVPGTVVTDTPVEIDLVCGTPTTYEYRYTAVKPQAWLITAEPGEVVNVLFAQGEIDVGDVVTFYDGAASTDPVLFSVGGSSLAGVIVSSTGTQMFIEIIPAAAMPDALDTWQFQVSCAASNILTATTILDDCGTYTFNVSTEVLFGDGLTYNFNVYLNGSGTPIVFGPYSGEAVYDLGDYPIGSVVSVFIEEDGNPDNSLWLGTFVTQGTCPDDPCAPLPDFSVRVEEDCAAIPVDGSPFPGIVWMTNETCLGFPANTLITWNAGLAQYEVFSTSLGQIFVDSITGEYYIVTATDPTPYFQLTVITPTGNSPLNATLWMPTIAQFGLVTNRPVAIQVSTNGILWTDIWTGTEQQLITPLAIAITIPFTQSRSLWNYLDCGFIGPVSVAN